uniref:Scaffolding protein n=1 Tax=viral metagenome TaxID=1070528 RepID=A0A6M3KIZ6_9ZZZZ
MSEEGKENIVEEIQPDATGKYPENVPWSQYVGIKESLGKKLDTERQKVTSLEEKLKGATSTEEVEKLKVQLTELGKKAEAATQELTTFKEQSLSERRATLVKRGIPEEKTKEMSGKELDAAFAVLEHIKPNPDMGGGGGGTPPATGTGKIRAGWDALHPSS